MVLNGEVLKTKVVIEPVTNGISDITVDASANAKGIYSVTGVKQTQQWNELPAGIYIVDGVNAVISAKVEQAIDLGTHTLFIAEVTDAFSTEEDPSATYAYYHKRIKPAPQQPKKKGWICTVCGYIYEGEELPADFTCPICKHPASDFEKL